MSDHLLLNLIANRLVEQAEKTVGIHEIGGDNQGPEVEVFQRTIGINRGEPWCMSWLQTVITRASLQFNSQNPLYASELCRAVWFATPMVYRSKIPSYGYGVIWHSHCGLVTLARSGHHQFNTIEGNTNVDGDRDGDAVHRKIRYLRGGVGPFELLGFVNLPQMILDSIPGPSMGKSA